MISETLGQMGADCGSSLLLSPRSDADLAAGDRAIRERYRTQAVTRTPRRQYRANAKAGLGTADDVRLAPRRGCRAKSVVRAG
jgi:hypothetical protein